MTIDKTKETIRITSNNNGITTINGSKVTTKIIRNGQVIKGNRVIDNSFRGINHLIRGIVIKDHRLRMIMMDKNHLVMIINMTLKYRICSNRWNKGKCLHHRAVNKISIKTTDRSRMSHRRINQFKIHRMSSRIKRARKRGHREINSNRVTGNL
jgi:hypothetical protein